MTKVRLDNGLAVIDSETGDMELGFHRGQQQAWASKKRIVLVLAGTQSGKTVFGPFWLWREMKERGRGDYMVVSPSLTLMNLKVMPAFRMLFEEVLGLGEVKRVNNREVFYLSEEGERVMYGGVDRRQPTRVLFGYAAKPDTLESASLLGVWCDEAGQDDFKVGAWEAILRRLSLSRGRVLLTTTAYNLGWLKQVLHDPAVAGDPDIELVRFDSTENPAFSKEEYLERMESMPAWRFNMFYRGLFERPAGIIYDCFDPAIHKLPASFGVKIGAGWPRVIGLDFGLMNFAGLVFARDPRNNRYYLYREYPRLDEKAEASGEFSMHEHVLRLYRDIPEDEGGARPRVRAIGGAFSEDVWRREVSSAGLRVERPDQNDVELGITRVYGAIRRGELFILDSCVQTLDEIARYARKLDPDTQEPTEEIENKNSYHFLDCMRYAIGTQMRGAERGPVHRVKRRVRLH